MATLLQQAVAAMLHAGVAGMVISCSSTPTDDKGPEGTMAFYVQVQTSRDGIRIETNHVFAGKAPLTFKVLGDKSGTFHNFGSPEFLVRALPESPNGFTPTQVFKAGTKSSPGDRIPGLIFFDMDSQSGSFSVDSSARR